MLITSPSYKLIPQFTKTPGYHVTAGWDYLCEHWIPENVKEGGLQLDPDFQRVHCWTEDKQVQYIEYIMRGGISGRNIYFNHPGWMKSFKGEFVLVDGKQRIEAVRRFMENEIKAFGWLYEDFRKTRNILSMDCHFDLWINDLPTRKDVLQWYLDLNTGGVVHTTAEIEKVRKMLEAE
jgi:hypothetical protein